LGNTWFWPVDVLTTKIFSRVMSSPPMQKAILQRNFFVERMIPAGTAQRPATKHFIQEDAPDEIAAAIIKCFG
jgi:haloalkane dehalogenase